MNYCNFFNSTFYYKYKTNNHARSGCYLEINHPGTTKKNVQLKKKKILEINMLQFKIML